MPLRIAYFLISAWAYIALVNAQNTSMSAAFDPPGRSRFYFNPGDEIRLKIKGEDRSQTYYITQISEEGLLLENRHLASFSDIERITLYPRRPLRSLKGILLGGGVLFPVTGITTELLLKTMKPIDIAYYGASATPFLFAYMGIRLNERYGVSYRSKKNKIKPVIYKAPYSW